MNINSINPPKSGGADQNPASDWDSSMYTPPAGTDAFGSEIAAYPDIYYKLQPHILMACDQMDAGNMTMTGRLLDTTGDNIRANVLHTNPEVAEYTGSKTPETRPEARPAITYGYGYGPEYESGYDYRNRGFLRDLIDILLLREYYRRRRYPY